MNFAGFSRRFFSFIIDIALTQAAVMLILTLLFADAFLLFGAAAFIALAIVDLAAVVLYGAALESSKYRATAGKMFMGVKVVTNGGAKVNFTSSLLRNLIKTLSLCFPFLYLICIFTKNKQTFHDMAAKTFTVNKDDAVTAKADRSLTVAMIIFIALFLPSAALLSGLTVLLVKEGISISVFVTENAIKNGGDAYSITWPQKHFEDLGITADTPLTLKRNAEQENLLKNEEDSDIADIICYGFYHTKPFMFDLSRITYNSEISLQDAMLRQGLRDIYSRPAKEPGEFIFEETDVSGHLALKAVREKTRFAEEIGGKLGAIVRAAEVLNQTYFGKFEQVLVIREAPNKVWIARLWTSDTTRYSFAQRMMDSLRVRQ